MLVCFGCIDVMVNNVGLMLYLLLEWLKIVDWD